MTEYHDTEWGVPSSDERHHFEHLALEIFQAGLNWLTILKKRDNFRRAFARFEPEKVACFTDVEMGRLMQNAGIIRNRRKIEAAVHNASAFLKIIEEFNGFTNFVVRFKPEKELVYRLESEIPPATRESEALAKELKSRGFKFVGPTGCYAYMQSVGLVNDHIESCFRFAEIIALRNCR